MIRTSTFQVKSRTKQQARQSAFGVAARRWMDAVQPTLTSVFQRVEQPPPEHSLTFSQSPDCSDVLIHHRKSKSGKNKNSKSEKPKIIMNQLSTLEESVVKNYQMGSFYDATTRRWLPKKQTHSTEGVVSMVGKKTKNLFLSFIATTLMVVLGSVSASAQADVSLRKTIDNSMPTLGSTVKYTLWAINKGTTAATNVKISDAYPSAYVSLNVGSVTPAGGASFNITPSAIDWTIPSLAANDSVKLEFTGVVSQRGVAFNTAEVVSMSNLDADSEPGNKNFGEDDIASACFSVPLIIYPGDEYQVSIPTGYTDVVWYKDGNPVTSTTLGAAVNADGSLKVTAAGVYTFNTKVNGTCPATGCCELKIIPGEYGSLGNYVWEDTNKDGLQTSGETPKSGVKVYLLDALGNKLDSTLTDAGGFYTFNRLIDGETYKVKFVAPVGCTFTTAFAAGSTKNSDVHADGTTYPYTVSVYDASGNPRAATDSLRHNPNLDAGINPKSQSCDRILACAVKPGGSICMGDTAYISATTDLGSSVKWYLSAVDGDPIATTTSGSQLMIFPTTTTTYYAQISASADCPAQTRKAVTVVVNAKPATPTCGGTAINDCSKGEMTVNLNTYIQSLISTPGGTFEWHTGWNPSSPIVTNPTAVSVSGKYYLFEQSAAGCYGNAALLMVNIKDCACDNPNTIAIGDDKTICEGSTVSLSATTSSTNVKWTSSGTGTFSTTSGKTSVYTPSAADLANGTVTITATAGDPDGNGPCKEVSDALIVNISKTPMTPYNVSCADSSLCNGDKTKLFGFSSPGSKIKWYTSATGGTAIGTTPNATGFLVSPTVTTTYYAEACIGDCVNPVRVPVTVNVKDCKADLAVNKSISPAGPYSIGQTVTYAVTVTNNGPVNATSVSVTDALPAQLTYVSSAPAGYASGLWTVGSLTTGSSQTLMIQAKINASGTIKNTAIVSSPQNDPTKRYNDTSSVTINVTEVCDATVPLISCFNTNICAGEQISCTAVNCNGTVVWSTGHVGETLTLTPTASMDITAVCKKSETCISGPSNVIRINVNKPSAVTIVSDVTKICGGKATMIATGCTGGSVIWSDGQIGTMIQVSPSVATTYTASCRMNGCKSDPSNAITISISTATTAPSVTASSNSICAGDPVTLTASNCSGTISWSTGQTGATLTVSPSSSTSYSASCVDGDCKSPASAPVAIAVLPKPVITLTASKTAICGSESATITASGCTGTYSWSNGMTGASITVSPTATTNYTATCSNTGSSCVASGTTTISVGQKPNAPVVTCGKELICAGEALVFTAHNCSGTVTWSTGVVGTTMTVNPTKTTTYTATCTVNGCVSNPSIDAVIVVKEANISVSGSDMVCAGESTTLTAAGCTSNISWSNGATTATITVSPTAATTYTVTCKVNDCTASASKTVNINTASNPTVDANKTICAGESATLTASGCAGGYVWSTGATTASISVSPAASTQYTVKCNTGCSTSAIANVTVSYGETAIISGPTTHCGANAITLTASGCSTGYVWSTGATTSTVSVTPTANTTYEVKCAMACSRSVTHTVTIGAPTVPSITASATEVCTATPVTLTATGCSGTVVWSSGQTGNTITVSPTTNTTYSAVCSLGQDCKSAKSNEITIRVSNILAIPVISCSATRICVGESLKLFASNCTGTITWSNGMTGAEITVSPTTTTNYTAKCKVGTCESESSATATLNVGPPLAPIVKCDLTQVCAGSSVTITANSCDGKVIWSNGMTGSMITTTLTQTTSFSAICEGGNGCKSSQSNTMTVSVFGTAAAAPRTKDLVNICPGVTVDLQTAVLSSPSSGSTFVFKTGSSVSSPSVANIAAAGAGKYYVFEQGSSGCASEPGIVNVVVTSCENIPSCTTSPATANAGSNATICITSDHYTLNGAIGGAATSGTWTSDGTGRFENTKDLKTKYYFTLADVTKGSVKFTLTTNDPDNEGTCQAATASMTLTLNGVKFIPTISANKSTTICAGDEVVLTAADNGNYTYKWSNGATTKSITVRDAGKYSVKLVDAQGCCSISSAETTVTVGSNLPQPTVLASVKNACPANTVNLQTAVQSQPASSGGMFEYRTGNTNTSPILASPTVGSGTYYVFEKSTVGCMSPAARVDVSIDACITQPGDADLAVTIASERSTFNVNENGNFTVTVRNNGPAATTNSKIQVVLPTGLSFVSGAGWTKVSETLIETTVAALAVNQSVNLPFVAKFNATGDKEVTAKSAGSTQPDPITSNNNSMVTVTCGTCTVTYPSIGLALKADTVKKANGSYDITYTAIVWNNGNVDVKSVAIVDTLSKTFALPAGTTFTVVSAPMVNTGSALITNAAFNGSSDPRVILGNASSTLVQGKADTIKYVVNVVLPTGNTSSVTFNSNAVVSGTTVGNISSTITDISNNGTNPARAGSTPTTVTIGGVNNGPDPNACINIAFTNRVAADTVKKANGSYDIKYCVIVKNCGNVNLSGVSVNDSLSKAFGTLAYTIVSAPTSKAGLLTPNAAFNGGTTPSLVSAGALAVGKSDTICYTVNLVKGTNDGPFVNSATGTATGNGATVKSTGTSTIRFNLPSTLVGVAKNVKSVTAVTGKASTFDVVYDILVKNYGSNALTKVQVEDDLGATFGDKVLIDSARVIAVSANTFKIDSNYTGRGTRTKLLKDTESTLAAGASNTITLKVRANIKDTTATSFNNTAIAKVAAGAVSAEDASNTGTNPDPDGDGDPKNNNIPTATALTGATSTVSLIGISKKADTTKATSGYDIAYTIVLKNYGTAQLTNIQVSDSLSKVFADTSTVAKIKTMPSLKAGSGLKLNSAFSLTNPAILKADSSVMAAGKVDTISFVVNVVNKKAAAQTYCNTAYASAKDASKTYTDASVSGLIPDLNANGNPGDDQGCTNVTIPSSGGTGTVVRISEGLSPNNDPNSLNETWAIEGVDAKDCEVKIYNRWGAMVYYAAEYDNSFSGKANTGTVLGGSDLPDGTYFYCVVCKTNGKTYVGPLTIAR